MGKLKNLADVQQMYYDENTVEKGYRDRPAG